MSIDGQNNQDDQNKDEMTKDDQSDQQHGGPDSGREGSDEAANNPGTQEESIYGSESATAAQKSYIASMAVEAHEEVPFELTREEASKKIEELQKKTGRTEDTLAPQ